MAHINETVDEDAANYKTATEDTVIKLWNSSTGVASNITTNSNGKSIIYLAGALGVGVAGFLANGVVFTMQFFKRKSRKTVLSTLIHNLTATDFAASVFLIITCAVKLQGVYLIGTWGRLHCKLFDSNAMYAFGINGSVAGLMVITVERYTKIAHSIWYRIRFRPWMKYVALVFPWIYSAFITFPIVIATSDISNGRCLIVSYWSAEWHQMAYGVGTFIWKFILPLTVFVFCYTKILIVMKKQSKVHQSRSSNPGNCQMNRSEMNIIRTLLFVAGSYVLAYAPLYTYYLLSLTGMKYFYVGSNVYYGFIWISYLNVVINPIIYAVKSETVNAFIYGIGKRIQHKKQTSTVVPFTIDT